MEILIWILILFASLFVLSKSSDKLTKSAEKIGLWLRMSPFIVGVTIVAIGTSLPELVSSVFAVIQGNTEIVVGNVIGSNVTNILLILGVAAIFANKIKIKESFLRIDLMVLITSVFMLLLVTLNGTVTLPESIILILCFIVYVFYILKTKKPQGKELKSEIKREELKPKVFIVLLISLVLIFISAKFTIDSIVEISSIMGIGKEIIAATVVALGTSLPEFAVSIRAARKGKTELAIGNILGSNIFNVFAVTGISGLFGTLIVPSNMIIIGSIFMFVSTFLYFFSIKDKRLSAWDGMFLLLLYVLYIIQIVGWA